MAQQWEEQGFGQRSRNTDTYMQRISGIVYGENPRQGFARDGQFYHPDLEFQFPVPSGWHVINQPRSEEHTSELQSRGQLVCRLMLEKKKPEPIDEIEDKNTLKI